MSAHLLAAQHALAVGDQLAALEHLLDAWREHRSAARAELVERASALVDRSLPAIAGRTHKARHDRWVDLDRRAEAADVPRLLRELDESTHARVREKLERLALRPADPRIADACVRWIVAARRTTTISRPVWTRALRLIVSSADPRGVAPLSAKHQQAGQCRDNRSFHADLVVRLGRVLEALPVAPSPLDDEAERRREQQLIEAIRAALDAAMREPPPTEAALFASREEHRDADAADGALSESDILEAIYEAPDDDGPRRVYADFLTDRGDPRGELIALQIAHERTPPKVSVRRHVRRLERQHVASLLGAIEPAVDNNHVLLRRGLPWAAAVRFRTDRERAELLAQPAWRTLRAVTCDDVDALLHPSFANVRRLGLSTLPALPEPAGPPPEANALTALDWPLRRDPFGPAAPLRVAAALAQHHEPLPYRALCVSVPEFPSAERCEALGAAVALPDVRELYVERVFEHKVYALRREALALTGLAWLFEGAIRRQLALLSLSFDWWGAQPHVRSWLDHAHGACPALRQLSIADSIYELVFHRATPAAPRWSLRLILRDREVIGGWFYGKGDPDSRQYALRQVRGRLRRLVGDLEPLESVTVETPLRRCARYELEVFEEVLSSVCAGPLVLPQARRGT